MQTTFLRTYVDHLQLLRLKTSAIQQEARVKEKVYDKNFVASHSASYF